LTQTKTFGFRFSMPVSYWAVESRSPDTRFRPGRAHD
jgi:hypothetical protein